MRLLVAEDETGLADALEAILTHAHYSVDVVNNGRDALEYARAGEYDGMILDIMMPGMSGLEVLRTLRAEGSGVPALFLTAKSGVSGTFALNGDSAAIDQAYFTIHGTGGILRLGDANQFGGEAAFLPNDFRDGQWRVLPPVSALSDNCRGLGPADMARCLREGGTPRVAAPLACHVLDVMEQILRSGESGQACMTRTACERPAPFDNWEALLRARE